MAVKSESILPDTLRQKGSLGKEKGIVAHGELRNTSQCKAETTEVVHLLIHSFINTYGAHMRGQALER